MQNNQRAGRDDLKNLGEVFGTRQQLLSTLKYSAYLPKFRIAFFGLPAITIIQLLSLVDFVFAVYQSFIHQRSFQPTS